MKRIPVEQQVRTMITEAQQKEVDMLRAATKKKDCG